MSEVITREEVKRSKWDVASRLLLEIKKPEGTVSFRGKVIWTFVVLLIYLIMSELPLFGISKGGYDYLYWSRVLLASSRGTVLELGIGPIVTAGLIMQILVGSEIIKWDLSDIYDRKKFAITQKYMSIIIGGIQAALYINSGAFGQLSLIASILIFWQLFIATYILILLDESLQKGWGIGSGISLFIAAGVSKRILWSLFSVAPASDGYSLGAVIQFFQALSKGDMNYAIFRDLQLPSIFSLMITIIVIFVIIIMEMTSVQIPISYARARGFRSSYPIRLLYISVIPIIMVQILYTDIMLIAQILWSRDPSGQSLLVQVLGTFRVASYGGTGVPVPAGGLVYYITPPRSIHEVLTDPQGTIRLGTYSTFLIVFSAIFARMWLDVAGMSPRDIARQLVLSDMQIVGFRRSERIMEEILKRYIPVIATLGGILVALISIFSNLLNVIGTGTGILLLIDILYNFYQSLAREYAESIHPALREFLGIKI